jgi:hypothetical protein
MLLCFILLVLHKYVTLTAFTNDWIETDTRVAMYVCQNINSTRGWVFTSAHIYGGAEERLHAITVTLLNPTHRLANAFPYTESPCTHIIV